MCGRSWKVAAALGVAAAPCLILIFKHGARAHYLSPAFGAFLVLAGIGIQTLWKWRIGGYRAGPMLAVGLMGVATALCARDIVVEIYLLRHPQMSVGLRPQVVDRLEKQGGKHLVIVHYSAEHSAHDEWVYNRADIDAADIVWAQDMGRERNQELLDYYRGRKVWLLEPDRDPLAVSAYPGTAE
jgi:hypothetical protein